MKVFIFFTIWLTAALYLSGTAQGAPGGESYVFASSQPESGLSRHRRAVPEPTLQQRQLSPSIYSMQVHSSIRYRYSTTLVTCRAANPDRYNSTEISFQIVLPSSAYISKFVMDIDGTQYEASVKEKDEAQNIYDTAKAQGRTGALVQVSARDANLFVLSINLKPASKITLNLTYEELLVRRLGRYEQIIHLNTMQTKIPDFKVSVSIAESQNITFLRVPRPAAVADLKIRAMRQVDDQSGPTLDPADKRNITVSRHGADAVIDWIPDKSEAFGGTKFVVQYDVARPAAGGEILLMNGYFVHFFVPSSLHALRKHMIFVLDVSGSMTGRKMEQLKNAMNYILDDLKPDDFFNIITFSTAVQGWNPASGNYKYSETDLSFRWPILATEGNLQKGHRFINSLIASGWTNINSALVQALNLASAVRHSANNASFDLLPQDVDSVILFLTDGEPTKGVLPLADIYENVRRVNVGPAPVPIYSLAFGDGADFEFVKKLSVQNGGFGRKIYEASDADLQLQGFYMEISSPLLSGAKFRYTTTGGIAGLTQTSYSKVFDGSEVVVAGKMQDDAASSGPLIVEIDGWGRYKRVAIEQVIAPINTNSTQGRSDGDEFLERFWAYLTIKQLIEKDLSGNTLDVASSESDESLRPVGGAQPEVELPRQRAIRLALKYKFVTPLTSLVVVKPNDTDVTNTLTDVLAPSHTDAWSGPKTATSPPPATTFRPPPAYTRQQDASRSRSSSVNRNVDLFGLRLASNRARADNGGYSSIDVDPCPWCSMPARAPTTTTTTTTSAPRQGRLSLDDISWLPNVMNNYAPIYVNGTAYEVATRRSQQIITGMTRCSRPSSRAGQLTVGECKHLKDCVLLEFASDVQIYYDNFFCPLKTTRAKLYAGACC